MKTFIVRQAFMGTISLEVKAENEEEAIAKFESVAEDMLEKDVLEAAEFENPEAEEI